MGESSSILFRNLVHREYRLTPNADYERENQAGYVAGFEDGKSGVAEVECVRTGDRSRDGYADGYAEGYAAGLKAAAKKKRV